MDTLRELLSAAVFVVLAALFLRMLIVNIRSAVLRKKTPAENKRAKVISKSAETGSGEFVKDGVRKGKTVYFLTFDCGGEELNFGVLRQEYDSVSEGDTGYLTYSGNKFFGFEKDLLLKESDLNEKTDG